MGSFLSVPVCIALSTLGVTVLCYWFQSNRRRPSAIQFSKLHQVPEFTPETSALASSEWPSRKAMFDSWEPNFVDSSSLSQSCDTFPCHVIATAVIQGERHVVAHVMLGKGRSTDVGKFQRMLKVGLPVEAVKQAMQVAGVDPAYLNLGPSDAKLPHPPASQRDVQASSLVVMPELRGLGLGKSMCAFALQVASELGATQIVGGCSNELVSYYERLGMSRRTSSESERRAIPNVRLGNEMYLEVSDDVLKEAEQTLKEIRTKFA